MRIEPSFLFVLAWKAALDAEKIELSVWRIHRKIGMSGGLFTISCCARLRLNRSRAW